MHEYTSLENFWKRYNKVLLDKVAMDKEKSTLLDENQRLRTVLKQYLDGISVNDEILSNVNPLFVVNQQTNVPYVTVLFSVTIPTILRAVCCVWKETSVMTSVTSGVVSVVAER